MHSLELFILLFACSIVFGFKLNGEISSFDNIELNNVLKKNQNVTWEKSLGKHKVILSNTIRNLNNGSIVNLNDFYVWNPYDLAKIWFRFPRKLLNVSLSCQENVTRYIEGLLADELWALKMMDATGRYTWGLHSGNTFWLGAADQCREIDENFMKKQKNGKGDLEDVPPFSIGVSSATLQLNIRWPMSNETYRIIYGLCLPKSCNEEDAKSLLHFAVEQRENNSSAIQVIIEKVRNLSKGYSLSEDPIFYVLLITFGIVIFLAILATFYDISLRYQVLRAERKRRCVGATMTEMKILNPDADCVESEITMAELWSVKKHNGSLDVCNADSVPKPFSEALLSFSVLLNLSKLFSFDVNVDTLAPIHGLRFLSMIWIILVHTCLTVNVISEGKTFKSKAESDFFYQTISNGTYAVDTFFFISGCLVSFLYFRTITKDNIRKKRLMKGTCGQVIQFLGMIWYRYFRLTPVYLLVIGLIEVSMSWYYHNTVFDLYTLDYENCRKFWWRNALYVNTYFPMDERCVVWSWYLANDTLFYTIGIIILIIGARFLPAAGIVTFFILIASWIITGVISLNVEHIPSIQDPFAHYESLYDKPWSRIGPYLFGMIAGWYLYKTNCKLQINKGVALILWTLSFVVMLSIVYGLYGNTLSPFISAVYTALSHSGWSLSIAWILIACVTGNGGIVNKALSWKHLYPLSRLTYCAYLVHPAIIRAVVLSGESSIHLTQGLMAILFLGFTIATYAVSLFVSLFFEAPMVSLLRIIHPLRQWKKTK